MADSDFSQFKRFRLWREQDITGTSGTGFVAEGTQFSSGKVVVNFYKELAGVSNVEVFDNLSEAVTIHGHKGKTKIIWID